MATGIKSLNATWSRANTALAGFIPRDLRDFVVGEYLFGGDEASSIFNIADPSRQLTVQGAPTYNAHSAVVRSHKSGAGFGFKTGITPNMGCTLILVRKNAALSAQPCIMGMDDSAGNGFGFRQFTGDNYMSAGETLYSQGSKRTRPGSAGTVYLEMVTHAPYDYATARYGSGGTLTKVISPNATSMSSRLRSDNVTPLFTEICIGSNSLTDSVNNNSIEVFYAAIVNSPFSDDQAGVLYGNLDDHFSPLGVDLD